MFSWARVRDTCLLNNDMVLKFPRIFLSYPEIPIIFVVKPYAVRQYGTQDALLPQNALCYRRIQGFYVCICPGVIMYDCFCCSVPSNFHLRCKPIGTETERRGPKNVTFDKNIAARQLAPLLKRISSTLILAITQRRLSTSEFCKSYLRFIS